MDISKLTTALVGLAVMVIFIVTMIPIIESAELDQRTMANNTGGLYSSVAAGDSVVVEFVEGVPQFNGTPITTIAPDADQNNERIYLFWENGLVVFVPSSSSWIANLHVVGESVVTVNSITGVEIANKTITVTKSSDSYTYTYEKYCMVPDANGDYLSVRYASIVGGQALYADPDSTIYAVVNSSAISMVASGTISDIVPEWADTNSTLFDTSSITIGSTPTDYDASNKIDSVTIEADGSTIVAGNSYLEIVVPVEYTVITDDQNTFVTLIGIIPLLLIIVVVLYAARLVAGSRN